MPAKLKLYQIDGSPNNVKVRLALGYKGLDYEKWNLPMSAGSFPFERSELVKVSGQPRTPVLQHGDTVIFDSGAILRYLEANFRDTPRLFSSDWQEHGEIESWEMYNRTEIGPGISRIFAQALSPAKDEKEIREANEQVHKATGKLEAQLSESAFLVGDAPTAADMTCAATIGLAMKDAAREEKNGNPIGLFFAQNLCLGDDRDRTAAWARKVLAYDKG